MRYGLVQVVLDVPDSDTLLSWAAEPHKRLAVDIVFRNIVGGIALETLNLKAAYCVSYAENFTSGDTSDGAYQCSVVLTDPNGFTIQQGGPSVLLPASKILIHPSLSLEERESSDSPLVMPTNATVVASRISDGLSVVVASCIQIIQPKMLDSDTNPDAFRNAVLASLEEIYTTPTGQQMLESLAKSGKVVEIHYSSMGNAIGGYEFPAERFLRPGSIDGAGTNSKIAYNPGVYNLGGDEPWAVRPPAIGLAHELVHAEQAAYGRMQEGKAPNGLGTKPTGSNAAIEADVRELDAVGIPPYNLYPFNENKLRTEWNPPQPNREWY